MLRNYQLMSGPDFLECVADAEESNGNSVNAHEYRRRAKEWQRDIDACEQSAVSKDSAGARAGFDLIAHLRRQQEFSLRTFGPGVRTKGVVQHIRKELEEIEAQPDDVTEWIDVAILALDGAWRTGATSEQIAAALEAKQATNERRAWPDWRTRSADEAIEHDRTAHTQESPT